MRGKYIVLEGIDASGKNTLIEGILNALQARGKSVYDVREYWLRGFHAIQSALVPGSPQWCSAALLPPHPIKSDIIVLCEPPYQGEGQMARLSLDRAHRTMPTVYNARAIGRKHAAYRETILPLIVGPALAQGKMVLSSRSFFSFPLQWNHHLEENHTGDPTFLRYIFSLPGNQLAMRDYKPNLLIIQDIQSREEIQRRLVTKDTDSFEQIDFQVQLAKLYTSTPFINGQNLPQYCTQHQIPVAIIDGAAPKEQVIQAALHAMEEHNVISP